jgi:ribokinase
MPASLAVLGGINMDLIVRAPRLPKPGETVTGHAFHTAPGGKGANQAVAAARLGATVSLIGRVGHDAHGDALLTALAHDHVNTQAVRVDDEAATGVALIELDDSGQNSIIVAPGVNMRVTPDDVTTAQTHIQHAAALLLQLEVPLDVNLRAMKLARATRVARVPVVLNLAPARKLSHEVLAQIDYLVVNETEAALLSELSVSDVETARSAARALRNMGCGTVIITLGERGAWLCHADGELHAPAFSVNVVDTTAAGDAFVAGFAVALTQGQTLANALRFANAVGALTVTKLGAQPSLPMLIDVQCLLQET